ncbi:heterogeneous nuclear ribonucleoprotein A3-like isoform X1 [Pomacea canaliculata]|nr:heterogeneous nuclear ribonucleoprotein A3-like isoform X1 [Pomacea canaliculata]
MPRDDPINQQSVQKMFVGGLKDDTTEEMVRECFGGDIESVEMIKDKTTGKSRGFCFVTFSDADTVDKHVLKKHYELNGRRVEVKKAFSKSEIGFGRNDYGNYGPGNYGGSGGFGGGGGGGYGGYGPSRGGYGGGNYGGQGGYGSQGWNQGGGYGDYGYGGQGERGGWGNQNYNAYNNNYGGGPVRGGGYGGGGSYNRR